jgi:hypothetical protein
LNRTFKFLQFTAGVFSGGDRDVRGAAVCDDGGDDEAAAEAVRSIQEPELCRLPEPELCRLPEPE